MIYVDTSVVLAHLLAEDRAPPAEMWSESLVASRLLEYELWNRLGALEADESVREMGRLAIGRIAFLELVRPVVSRAMELFPVPVRTLDALHLASAEFLRDQGQDVKLATYDARMTAAADRLGVELYAL